MLGTKLIMTGLLLVSTASIFIKAIGEYPGPVLGVTLISVWVVGAAMIVFGILVKIWE